MNTAPAGIHKGFESLLAWQAEAGVDVCLAETPQDRKVAPPPPVAAQPAAAPTAAPRVTAASPAGPAAVSAAQDAAARAQTLEALHEALASYEGCGLKKTARSLVFGMGMTEPALMVIGEAPGADEDRQGLPFVGPSGKLLDRMLASIGLSRESNAYITNIVPWRPPGNRNPNAAEIAVCLPFLEKHIALVRPKLILALGGSSAATLLGATQGIGALRGKPWEHSNRFLGQPVPLLATFHPAYLLRQPGQKRLAWRDLLLARSLLDSA